jgi:hypothetical protein
MSSPVILFHKTYAIIIFLYLQLEQFPLLWFDYYYVLFYDCFLGDWVLSYELFLCMSSFNSDLFYILGMAKEGFLI